MQYYFMIGELKNLLDVRMFGVILHKLKILNVLFVNVNIKVIEIVMKIKLKRPCKECKCNFGVIKFGNVYCYDCSRYIYRMGVKHGKNKDKNKQKSKNKFGKS